MKNPLNLFRGAAVKVDFNQDLLALADRLVPADCPVSTPEEARALDIELQRIQDLGPSAGVDRDVVAAIRPRRELLSRVYARLNRAARIRTSIASEAADRAHFAQLRVKASEVLDALTSQSTTEQERVKATEERLAKLQASLAALTAATSAQLSAAEDELRAAIGAGNDAAEVEAARRHAGLLDEKNESVVLKLRIVETQRLRDSLAATAARVESERQQALQALRDAEGGAAAVETDAALSRAAFAMLDFGMARNAAIAAGVNNAAIRFAIGGVFHVARAGRAWYIDSVNQDAPADVIVGQQIDALCSLLASNLPSTMILAERLPGGAMVKALADSLSVE